MTNNQESPQNRGMFLTLEGMDGTGKSTHAKLLATYIEKEHNQQVFLTREPGGTALGETLRKMILYDLEGYPTLPLTEAFLMLAARSEHTHKVILPKLDKNIWVISDRYTDSTLAYQGMGQGISLKSIEQACMLATKNLVPDCTILLDIHPQTAQARMQNNRDKKPDHKDSVHENQLGDLKALRENYLALAKKAPERFLLIDAEPSIEQVQKNIQTSISQRIQP